MAWTLYIANRNYSSWSLRAWLALRGAGIAFEEVRVSLHPDDADEFRRRVHAVSPAGRVPVLVDDEGFAVWDSLAIVETAAERRPDRGLWPAEPHERARARSFCAEMHSGFAALRSLCPMNIEADLRAHGESLMRREAALRGDVARIDALWRAQLEASGGPLLFGGFTAADAFFAPVVWRFVGYGLPAGDAARRYLDAMQALPAMAEWRAAALAEHSFVAHDEPYRRQRGGSIDVLPAP